MRSHRQLRRRDHASLPRLRPLGLMLACVLMLGIAPAASASSLLDQAHVAQHSLNPGLRSLSRAPAARGRGAGERSFRAFTGPIAKAAGVNSVVPKFKFHLIFSPVNSHKIRLKGFTITPFFKRFESFPIGGCNACSGNGHFAKVKIRGTTLIETMRGARYLTNRTRFTQAITSPGEIGRYKVVGVNVAEQAPVLRGQGCLAADAPIANSDFLNHRLLPAVPCSARVPKGDHVGFSSPLELAPNHAETVSGHASGARWLSVYQSHSKCAVNAEAEAPHAVSHGFWFVGGNFRESFVATDSSPGFFCIYLQTGGRFHKVPDGRVSVSGSIVYLAGDKLQISGPSSVAPGGQALDTFTGSASIPEELYDFVSYAPCAATAQAEYQQAAGVYEVAVQGPFSKSVNSVPFAQSGFICAYLQVGAPSGVTPTGPTVVSAAEAVSVS